MAKDAETYRAHFELEGPYGQRFKSVKNASEGQGLERLFVTGVSPVPLSDPISGFNTYEDVSLKPELACPTRSRIGSALRIVTPRNEERRDHMATLEAALAQAFQLSTLDKVRLIEKVTPKIEEEIQSREAQPAKAYRSLWGLCRGLGSAPSAEDIDQVRREMWAGFPRDDVE